VICKTIEKTRETTNKLWILSSDFFKEMIEDRINRPMNPRSKGGDRKSNCLKTKLRESGSIDYSLDFGVWPY